MEYTVAGWAKLDDKTAIHTLAAQGGTVKTAFKLHYSVTSDRWAMALTDVDADTVNWATVSAPAPTPVGVWQHVAATVDPVSRVLRLYIDGSLAAEKEIPYPLWNAQGRFLIGCSGSATGTWDRSRASIDHVGIWQGLLSDAQIARAATELPAGLVGEWKLRGDGTDTSGFGRDITVPAGVTWVEDQFGRTDSAAYMDGTQCLTASAPVVRTDESFSVGAWAKTDTANPDQTLLMQHGQVRSGFKLMRSSTGRWTFTMPSVDADGNTWHAATAPQPAPAGVWQHVVGVYDATAHEVKLYVDGVLVTTNAAPHIPWNTIGPLALGCTLGPTGSTQDLFTGAASDVKAWRGALTPAQVAAEHGGNPPVALNALWPLDGPESDQPTLLTDVSGNGHDLSVAGSYAWVRDRGFGRDGALGLELAEGSCAQTVGPVVATDESFTVTAWVLLESITGSHTVVAQAATQRSNFALNYSESADRWTFVMTSADTASAGSGSAVSSQPPDLGVWTHLAGVYDVAAGKLRLYVNGVPQGEADGPATPWAAAGPTLVGCAGTVTTQVDPLGGVVDDVRVWSSTLDPDRIADLAAA
jgi:hypothetical protein